MNNLLISANEIFNWNILLKIVLLGIALSMDAFAVSITDGLIYSNINKRKSFFIAGTFGIMQGVMPLIGFWIVFLVEQIVGSAGGIEAGKIMSHIVTWISFALLIFIGIKMIIDSAKDIKKPKEDKKPKLFSFKEVLLMGLATSIDAMASGVTLSEKTLADGKLVYVASTPETIWIHVAIIMAITFVISLLGVLFGKFFEKLFKGKYEISGIIGGCILIALAIWIAVSHYVL